MNKSILVFTIIAAGLLLIVHSCTKEEAQTLKSQDNKLTPYEIKVHNTIKGFIRTIEMYRENPHYKSGQLVSPDSALWLLEATINYSHGFPNEFYTGHEVEELTLVIPKTSGGMIDIAVLTQKYDEMKSNITAVYYGSSFTDKGLVLVDLEEEAQTETELILSVQTVTGERGVDPGSPGVGIDGPFEEGDDWWYGEDEGKCNGQPVYKSDAAKELKNVMNAYLADINSNYSFINIQLIEKKGGQPDVRRVNDPEPPDNSYDYYLFHASEVIVPFNMGMLCLEYPMMNTYYSLLKYLLFTVIPADLPPGFSISHISVYEGNWGWTEETNPSPKYYFHKGSFHYGEKIGVFEAIEL